MKDPEYFKRKAKKLFNDIVNYSRLQAFPLPKNLKNYSPQSFGYDIRAAINVSLLAFPQGMAYALIAGLPIQYGIYGSAIAATVAPFFAGSRYIMLGPTNATSVLLFSSMMTLGVAEEFKLALLPLLLILTGLFLIIGAFLRVASLIQYVSQTVVTGYITAAAIYIIVNQLDQVLGIEYELPDQSTFLDVIWLTLSHLPITHLPSLCLAAVTAITYMGLQRKFKMLPNVAITLVLMSVFAWGMGQVQATMYPENEFWGSVKLLSEVDATEWKLTFPILEYGWVSKLIGIAAILAFLSILEGASIGKSLAAKSGEKLDTNQEMLSMGVANVACAFGGGMPASGSLTRSKLNADSGAKTPLSSLMCGLFCAIGAFVLGPYIKYTPLPVLGTLVIFIGLSLINLHNIRVVTKSTHSDAAVFITTFVAALLIRLDFAIILGAGTSILLFLRKASSPELVEYSFNDQGHLYEIENKQTRPNPQISIVHVEGDLFFGASELFRDQVRRVCEDPNLKVIILRLRNAYHLDATSVMALEELIRYLKEQDRHLIVSGARIDVYKVFRKSALIDILGKDNFFMGAPQNPNVATRKALKRAQELLGGVEADIRIFYDPNKKGGTGPKQEGDKKEKDKKEDEGEDKKGDKEGKGDEGDEGDEGKDGKENNGRDKDK